MNKSTSSLRRVYVLKNMEWIISRALVVNFLWFYHFGLILDWKVLAFFYYLPLIYPGFTGSSLRISKRRMKENQWYLKDSI